MVIAKHDVGAVEALYREQGARLERAILAHTGSPSLAQDAVAEAFAQLLRRGEQIRDPAAWVWRAAFRIAGRTIVEWRTALPLQEAGYEMSEEGHDLMGALRKLSPKQRAAIILHHYAGYPVKDVAAIIGSTRGAVRVHLSVGRRRLRELLEVRDG